MQDLFVSWLLFLRWLSTLFFFHYLYKNNNSLNLTKLLERKVINERNRTNAITFFGHFCSFAIELTQIAIYAAAQRRKEENIINGSVIYEITLNSYQIGFAAISIVEVLTSNILRLRLIHKLEKIPLGLFNLIFNIYGN